MVPALVCLVPSSLPFLWYREGTYRQPVLRGFSSEATSPSGLLRATTMLRRKALSLFLDHHPQLLLFQSQPFSVHHLYQPQSAQNSPPLLILQSVSGPSLPDGQEW